MRIFNSLYPYPVLSLDDEDYINGSTFYVEYTLAEATSFKPAVLTAKFVLEDEQLERMIKTGVAGFLSMQKVPDLLIVIFFEVDEKSCTFELVIDAKTMRQKLEVTSFIILKQDLTGYQNKNINPELYGVNYIGPNLSTGDPLAVAFTEEIEISEVNDFRSVSSIMKVGKTNEKLMNVDIESDSIYVRLPEKQYMNYVRFGTSSLAETMLSSIIFPSLIYALDAIANNSSEIYSSQKWYQVIEKKIDSLNYSIAQLKSQDISSVVLAQAILENPLERTLIEIGEVVSDNDED